RGKRGVLSAELAGLIKVRAQLRSASLFRSACRLHAERRQRGGQQADLAGVRRARIAREKPKHDALRDGGEAEERERQKERIVLDLRKTGTRRVARQVCGFSGDA